MSRRRLAALLLGLALPLAGQAGSSQAVEMGCYNCHGQPTRADAPSFERLSARFAGRAGQAGAEEHVVDELRRGEFLQHIPVHQRLSPQAARQLVHWLFEGGK